MSSSKKEYDVFKGLPDGSQVNSLDKAILLSCVQEKTLSDLGTCKQLYVLNVCDLKIKKTIRVPERNSLLNRRTFIYF